MNCWLKSMTKFSMLNTVSSSTVEDNQVLSLDRLSDVARPKAPLAVSLMTNLRQPIVPSLCSDTSIAAINLN